MEALVPTLVLTPSVVLAVSLAQRRWGPAIGGRLAGLPLSSGPLVLFVAVTAGPAGAHAMAEGVLTGLPAAITFCALYVRLAHRHSWPTCLTVAVTAAVLAGTASSLLRPPVWTTLPLIAFALLITPRRAAPSEPRPEPRWELPVRMAVTTALVGGLATLSTVVDHHLAGALASFPALVCVLAPLAHRRCGPGAATALVRGVLAGLPLSAAFFLGLTL